MNFETEIIKEIQNHIESKIKKLEVPPDPKLGDYALPCFVLAKELKKNPVEIARELSDKIKPNKVIKEVKATGPYVNFFINSQLISKQTIKKILKDKDNYGAKKEKKTVMVEYCAPNTNKPLHLGHLRNIMLGNSISRILAFLGNKVIQVNLVNDRGVHICKSMIAYQKWGEEKLPDKKPDHFVGDFYVLYSKNETPELENETQEMLRKWEAKDNDTIELWKKMNKWALDGFEETFKRLNIEFDKVYYESEIYNDGKKIVKKALKKGLLKKDENENTIADLKEYNLPDKVVLRSDGTTVYMTQDLALATQKFIDYKLNRSIYVVGSEQNTHFKQLFKILEILGSKASGKCEHISYGLVHLPEGRMKSREGTVIDADDLLTELESLAKKEVTDRDENLSVEEVKKRSIAISHGALRYELLKVDAAKDIIYDPKQSISFEGDTGPYIQYAHARISSILRKSDDILGKINYSKITEKEEIELVKKLAEFPSIVEEAGTHLKPHLITNYLSELSQLLSEFYHNCPVLKAKGATRKARITLIICIQQVIKNGLNLLGIEAPEAM